MKKVLCILIILFALGLMLPVRHADAQSERHNDALFLPPHDQDAEIVYLGRAKDPKTNEEVEGYAYIYRVQNNSAKSNRSVNCYGYLSNGAKWKTVESWIVNTDNTSGLDSNFVYDNLVSDVAKWKDATDGTVGDGLGTTVLGSGSVTSELLTADTSAPDNKNEVYFGNILESGVIAVTSIWGIFSGPIRNRQLVEWDIIFDQNDFDWSATGESTKMDFENIATHELGHSTGMNDLYNSSCNLETMFGYASNGETIKRDLHSGDINGINLLY